MFVIIGYVIAVAGIIGGYILAGGHMGVLWQPNEMIIILGGAIGAFVVSNNPTVFAAVGGTIGGALAGSKYNKAFYLETLTLLYKIFTKIRQGGLLSIEGDIENPSNSELFKGAPGVLADHHALEFITDYLRLMANGGLEPHQVENLMDIELETHHHEGHIPIEALAKLADGLPAFGIVAAVMGVVHVMGLVGNASTQELGAAIGGALVGTFLGILFAYGIVGPLTGACTHNLEASAKYFVAVKAALLATMNGYAPPIAVEFARKTMLSYDRPGFSELEEHIKANK
ncbi:MAG: flagellar motor stator protein MotA [Pseudomonadota bacterium]